MSCVERPEKKYQKRPSPPYSAQSCPGMIKEGNNGKLFISTANVKGVYQWKSYSGVDQTHQEKNKKLNKTSRKTKKSQKTSRRKSKSQKTSRKTSKSQKTSRKKSKSTSSKKNPQISKLDCSKVVRYRKTIKVGKGKMKRIKQITGLELEKGYIHLTTGFNKFKEDAMKIPIGYQKTTIPTFTKKFYCDETRNPLTQDNELVKKIKYPGATKYLIHDNGGRPYLVYINKNQVNVYKSPGKSSKYFVLENDYGKHWTYVIKVASYKPIKVFVGKSPLTAMTKYSAGYGKGFDGNSILLQVSKDRYVFIGENIYEFSTNDKIKEFISPVGNSDVPYPVAIGEKNVYFMLDKTYVPNDKFPNLSKEVKEDAYHYYYGRNKDVDALSKYSKKMLKYKLIEKRDF